MLRRLGHFYEIESSAEGDVCLAVNTWKRPSSRGIVVVHDSYAPGKKEYLDQEDIKALGKRYHSGYEYQESTYVDGLLPGVLLAYPRTFPEESAMALWAECFWNVVKKHPLTLIALALRRGCGKRPQKALAYISAHF